MAASRNPGPLERTRVPHLHDGTSNLCASPLTGPVGRHSEQHIKIKEKRRTPRAHAGLTTLRKGSQGSEVRWLQVLLNQHRASYSSLKEDGSFGPRTLAAVVAFQQTSSLSADGVVGLETWSKVLLFNDSIARKPPLPTVFTLASLNAPEPPRRVSDAPVATWSLRLRFEEVLRLAPNHMAPQLAAQFRAMLTPVNVAIMVTTLAGWAVSHAFGVGEIADIVMAVLGAVFLGLAAFKAGEDLGECLGITLEAKSEEELDEAANYLAQAIAILGVVAFFALIAKVGAKLGGAAGAAEEEAAGGAAETRPARGARSGAKEPEEPAASEAKKPPKETKPSPEEIIAQRKSVAEDFYRSKGWPDKRIANHMKGIDFSKPVEVTTLKPGTVVSQFQKPGAPQGNYYTPPGTDPSTLGIDATGVVETQYVVKQPVEVLSSTSNDILDWNGSGTTFQGGGTQYFTTDGSSFTPQ